ncbi:hypothetical protein DPMN_054588 [Dreissena polymorpha]|uniref:Uncharacterized protein n=1 Tax=Dreissena polymorpha TaxID=45954 RepID=A0A9D4CNE2_DREPO|nr:hypothetical protein DPMN_054588 [Dreissena polymorpha]
MKICVVALVFLVVIEGTPIPVSIIAESTESPASIVPQTTLPSVQTFSTTLPTGPISIQTISPSLPTVIPFSSPSLPTVIPFSTHRPTPAPQGFDGGAFGGGIALGIGICVILIVAFICYTRRKGANYKAM